MSAAKRLTNPPPSPSFPVVGIGASAGGLEAIQSFFEATPADSGMAFVVIQHLSPDHKSLMVELLSRKTEIPVQRAEDGMTVAPNQIYLIPPKKNLTLFHGKLLLHDQKPRGEINLPVDVFLRSLAEDQGEHAVGVILSGTGSDGTRGVRAVKEWGGLVMVQDADSAKFDGMPRAAASTGLADFVLPPAEMPAQLIACIRHPYATRQARKPPALGDETGLTRLFSLLRAKTKVDFTYYKPSTIERRIERRIAVTQCADLDAYVRYAEQTPAEVVALYRELLIGVTSFFRDPPVMTLLRDRVLPELFERCTNREMRFWVAGCSTGEEPYTLAILAREVMEKMGIVRDVKIFATDIDRNAVMKAGAGIYPESIAADLSPALLTKYFYLRGDTYQVARSLREMVVFAQHNLVKDPPFTRIDLVSCRNLLIYLQPNLQQQALSMFEFSLNPGGVLVLGTSETVGDQEHRFEPIDRKARIFRAAGPASGRAAASPAVLTATADSCPAGDVGGFGPVFSGRARQHEHLLQRLLDGLGTYVPLAVAVNERLEILHTVGDPRGIFSLPSGRAVYDISRMVDRELAIPLATGIQKAFRTGEELAYSNLPLRTEDGNRTFRLRIRPLTGRRNDEPMVLVFFERIESVTDSAVAAPVEIDLDEETRQRVQDLEQELQFTRENLQATIEELETANEELQATNEELLASNEELQSTNEELQSTNEELHTVNAEYQNKIIELTESQNDVDNLLASSRVGILLLDEDLHIRRFSPQIAQVFSLVDGDVGRPLKHLSHSLLDQDPLGLAIEVQRKGELREVQARTEDGRWYLLRVLPYRIGPGAFAGIVITLIDISERKAADEELRESEQRYRTLADNGLALIWTSGLDRKCDYFNKVWLEFTGRPLEQELGDGWTAGVHPDDLERCVETYVSAFDRREPFSMTYRLRHHDGQYRWILDDGAPRFCDGGSFIGYIGHCFDITELVEAKAALGKSEEHHRHLYHLLADAEKTARMGSWTWEVATDTVTWSDNLYRVFGRDPAAGAPSFAEHDVLYTPESMQRLRQAVQATLDQGTPYEIELTAVRGDGGRHVRCIARGRGEVDWNGKVCRLYGSVQEV
jgi:two-component system CheB/CheR fusion protein